MSYLELIKSLDKRMNAVENRMFILLIAMVTNLVSTFAILILK